MINASQPQQTPIINWANPLTRGLVDIIDMTGVPRSLILKTPLGGSFGSPVYGTPGISGRSLNSTASPGGVYFQRSDGAYAPSALTLVHVGRFDGYSGIYAGLISSCDGSGTNNCLVLQYAGVTDSYYIYTATATTVTASIPLGKPSVVSISGDSTSTNLYVNGKYAASGLAVSPQTTSRLIVMGERTSSATYASRGLSSLVLVYNRTLNAVEHKQLSDNPWQVFAPTGSYILGRFKNQIPSPNPIFLMKNKIGYMGAPIGENNPSGGGVSHKHPGYNFSATWYNSWSSPTSTVLTVSPNAGDFVFLTIVGNGSINPTTVTDNAGGVWTNIVNSDNDGSYNNSFWYCNNIKPGTTSITATFLYTYPTTVKMVAASYLNMTGATLNNYSPKKTQTNPGTTTDSIKSNTAFFNASTYNSSNSSGLVVTTNNALVIGVTHQFGGSASYSAGTGYQLRRNYYGILHQDAEYNGMKDTQTIITATDSSGGTNSYTTYGFAFDQPIFSSTWYTAKYGEMLSRIRFKGRAGYLTTSQIVFGLRTVHDNKVVYVSEPVTITYQTSYDYTWEFPVAWKLVPGVTYSIFIYGLDNNAYIAYDTAQTYGTTSYSTGGYSIGSTWSDVAGDGAPAYTAYNAKYRFCISGDISKTAFINHRTSGSFQPSSSTAISPAFRVEKGDLILISCVFPSTPSSYTITDNAGNYVYIDRFSGNGVGTNTLLMASVQECVTSKSDYQFTITNGSSLTPYTIQYSVYSSSHPWEPVANYRSVAYSLGASQSGECFIPKTDKPVLVVSMGNSGNTTTTGDTVYSGLSQPVNRVRIPALSGSNPAIVVADMIGRAAANGAGTTYNYGDPGIITSLGASNGVTAPFGAMWTYASGPHTYRQAVGRTDYGTINMMPTRAKSLVLVFTDAYVTSVTDDKNTVYSKLFVDLSPSRQRQIFYGYPANGMSAITIGGGNTLSVAVEESDMAVFPVPAIESSKTDPALLYYAVNSITYNHPTLYPDVVYVDFSYDPGQRSNPIRSVDANNIYYPVLTTNSRYSPKVGNDSGGADVFTGEQFYETGGSRRNIFRAEFDSPQSNNAIIVEPVGKYFDGTTLLNSGSQLIQSVALKKPKLMLGPDVTKWRNLSSSFIGNGGTQSGAFYLSGYLARFSGYTTTLTMRGAGALYTNSGVYLAIYDETGKFVAKTPQVGDGTTYYTNAVNADVYGDITLPITAYLQKNKRYYIAFFCNNIYYALYTNPNTDNTTNSYINVGIDNSAWTYSYQNPPSLITQEMTTGFTTNNTSGGEFAIWINGIPTYPRQLANIAFQSASLIESYN